MGAPYRGKARKEEEGEAKGEKSLGERDQFSITGESSSFYNAQGRRGREVLGKAEEEREKPTEEGQILKSCGTGKVPCLLPNPRGPQ